MNCGTVLKIKKIPRQVERAYEKTTLRNMIYVVRFYLVSTVQGES